MFGLALVLALCAGPASADGILGALSSLLCGCDVCPAREIAEPRSCCADSPESDEPAVCELPDAGCCCSALPSLPEREGPLAGPHGKDCTGAAHARHLARGAAISARTAALDRPAAEIVTAKGLEPPGALALGPSGVRRATAHGPAVAALLACVRL